jgi:hypothetical protein
VAAVTMAEDIVIRTINIAVVAATIAAVSILAVRLQAVSTVAVRTQEAALLPEVALLSEAEAHMSPTAAAHAVGNR